MKAELLFHRKNIEPNGDIVEMRIWKVSSSKDKPHGLKYSLAYIREGRRVIGYDNAEGRGDHRHHGLREDKYHLNLAHDVGDNRNEDDSDNGVLSVGYKWAHWGIEYPSPWRKDTVS